MFPRYYNLMKVSDQCELDFRLFQILLVIMLIFEAISILVRVSQTL
jgi:hypothetical protein